MPMKSPKPDSDQTGDPPEARWPALIAVLAVALLYLALPPALVVGPRWAASGATALFATLSVYSNYKHWAHFNRIVGHVLSALLTILMVWSLVLLIHALPSHRESPEKLLVSAVALWVTNVLVFALWYWRLDAGGPHGRDRRTGHETGAFLFPPMTTDGRQAWQGTETDQVWSPQFVDYLYLAFNTSTAFSPTDVPVLSRWAKVLTMIQSSISLTVLAVLAARAVNIL